MPKRSLANFLNISLPTLTNPEKIPTEENFIQDYFKDIDDNPNITKIFKKYENVKNTFVNDVREIPKEYIDEPDKGNIKMKSSPGWEYVVKETKNFHRKTYSYNVSSQSVTSVGDKLFKEFVFSKDQYATLFMITLEITMQKMAYEILKANDYLKDKVIIPKITNHYQVDSYDKESYEIIIEMEYIEHKQLEQNNVDTAKNALEELRKHDIYHFDTHTDNIRQTEEGKIVILDFGKSQINKTPDVSSSTGLYNVDFDYKNWTERKPISPYMRNRTDQKFYLYGGKKNKSKRNTIKGKKKKGKSKKRTYRKRK